jgi:hypothetical protein
MDYRILELNLAQLSRCLLKSKFNKYSDKRKASYQKVLLDLFETLKVEDFHGLPSAKLIEKKKVIDFIFESLQYLDNSTLTIIPFEIVYCLETALNQWIPDNKFIVVTSLSNELSSYSINGNLAFNEPIYQLIDNDYNKQFEYRLVQITLPRYYVHDYLANVVLYHELGHFVDMHYNISQAIVFDLVRGGKLKPLPFVETEKILFHHMEYFADLFAAQYIGEASNYFLNYVANKALESHSHPATDNRLSKVIGFLKGDYSDQYINNLIRYTPLRTKGPKLEIRFKMLPLDDFFNLIPFEIKDTTDLHSILLTGWNAWLENPNKLKSEFDNDIAYKIINNLIEKSISNYLVVNSWK